MRCCDGKRANLLQQPAVYTACETYTASPTHLPLSLRTDTTASPESLFHHVRKLRSVVFHFSQRIHRIYNRYENSQYGLSIYALLSIYTHVGVHVCMCTHRAEPSFPLSAVISHLNKLFCLLCIQNKNIIYANFV